MASTALANESSMLARDSNECYVKNSVKLYIRSFIEKMNKTIHRIVVSLPAHLASFETALISRQGTHVEPCGLAIERRTGRHRHSWLSRALDKNKLIQLNDHGGNHQCAVEAHSESFNVQLLSVLESRECSVPYMVFCY
ncbi:hypothetical protein PM082_004435 [Marasmius tenuissimus]|nr:hypothetical protein PM082_004435 [Marasmius tenuissimus]